MKSSNSNLTGSKSECVKVVVRCRPLSSKEIEENEPKVVDVSCERGTIQLNKSNACSSTNSNETNDTKIYTFDSVYDCDSSQEDIYADVCHPLVESVLNGFNGTIFAYGQTGTGKTYTMEGVDGDPGVIPRSFVHIFSHILRSSHKQFLVRSSYLEIYQEEIRDLLSSNVNKRLELHERPDIGVYVKDLSSFVCKNVSEIERVLNKGRHNRSVGATNMNEHSSRSHAIFMITVEHIEKDSSDVEHIRVGKLNLVDLAGSERQVKTKTVGQRQKEAIKINLSLSALGNVISALVDGRSTHIPYRDSKLTRILQDSLGGNSRTVMIANIGPAGYNYEETLITLRYANRAKNIKNKPRVNENPKDTLLKEFQAEIERLRQQLDEKRKQKRMSTMQTSTEQIDVDAVEKLQAKIKAMESKMLVGGKDILDHTHEQQRQLERSMAELREQKQRERMMLRQLEEHEEVTQEVRETFSSLQQEVEMKRKKLRKIVKEFQSVNSEIRDLHELHSEDRRELERISSDLIRDLKLRYLMIDNFIPEHEKTRFLKKVYYDENDKEWHMKMNNSTIVDNNTDETNGGYRPSTSMSMSSYSRPCSTYSDRQSALSNDELISSKIINDFTVQFYRNTIDEVGLYMPELTTSSYLPNIDTGNNDDNDDNVQIEIYDLAETSETNNRSKTALSSIASANISNKLKYQSSNNKWMTGLDDWNRMIGNNNNNNTNNRSRSRMRRSQTVMDNYINEDDDYSLNKQIGSIDHIDINGFFDQKRINTRKKLFQSNQQNLNQRPDTAFPRSRGLVPK